MKPISLARPAFHETKVLAHLSKEYEMDGSLSTLPSDRDQNYLLTRTDSSQFVCKITNLNEHRDYLLNQNIIMNHLNKKNKHLTPKVRLNIKKEEITNIISEEGESYFFRVISYLPGIVYAKYKPHSSNFMFELGHLMAEIRLGLEDITLRVEKRSFDWDIEYGIETIKMHLSHVTDPSKSQLLRAYLTDFESSYFDVLKKLEKGVIQGDANDYNIIVQNPSEMTNDIQLGLIDFGDFVYSPKVADLAIAIAYAILDKKNPMVTIMNIIQGYSSLYSLNDDEMKALFPLIQMRLCISVSMSAFQKKQEPDNEYLAISEAPAWKALAELKKVSENYVYYLVRHACGFTPHPKYQQVVDWLKTQNCNSIFEKNDSFDIVDLSFGSLDIEGFKNADNLSYYTELIDKKLGPVDLVVGRYNESRLMYIHDSFEKAENGFESWRSVHLGIDLFNQAGTPINAPLSGEVFRVSNHNEYLDYGPTVILKHLIDESTEFYTLYGHLMASSISSLEIGQIITKGQEFAKIGEGHENGSWTPHVHVQIILDFLNYDSSFPGVCSYLEKAIWLNLCPNPNFLLKFSDIDIPNPAEKTKEISALRSKHTSEAMSISYQKPLHIVRGFAQYLYDIRGRRYLDSVNNVPTVGHSHPNIVRAMTRQIAVLNTNTRYLQEVFTSYSTKLLSQFPEKLEVVFFVNSGSEANELALRLATTYTSRDDFIVLDHAYHGNTNSAISISPYKFNGNGGKGKPTNVHVSLMPDPYRGKYQGSDTGNKYANEVKTMIDELRQKNTPIAAFIAESLPGVGGQIVIPDNYFPEVYKMVREAGGVCIADEVQVGFARMGTHYWGFEIYGVVPDIVTLGKPIGNGHPIGAVITTREIANAFANGMEFFTTTGGSTVSMAVGLAVLEIIETEKLQENAQSVGNYLLDKLSKIKPNFEIVGDVRGRGLYLGIEIVKDKQSKIPNPDGCKYIVEEMKQHGVLLSVDGPDHNVIKFKSPLVFSMENADSLIANLSSVLSHSCLK